MTSVQQRRVLGEFVRARRENLDPSATGLPIGGRRRTPGLRREETAQLCGVSTTWYTWIEQGRNVSVSSAALTRLADVLQKPCRTRLFVRARGKTRSRSWRGCR